MSQLSARESRGRSRFGKEKLMRQELRRMTDEAGFSQLVRKSNILNTVKREQGASSLISAGLQR